MQYRDFLLMPVCIRSELGVYTDKHVVYTDRQGRNTDHAGYAYGVNTDIKERHGGYWVLSRSLQGLYVFYWDISGL